MWTTTRLFSPFMGSVRRELDEAFDRSFGNGEAIEAANLPLTIWEDEGYVYVEADVPGFTPDGLDVMFQEGQLWIKAERGVPKDDGKCWHNERRFGRFERAVSLPETVDPASIEAELEHGVLRIMLSKKPEAQPLKINVKSGNGSQRLTKE